MSIHCAASVCASYIQGRVQRSWEQRGGGAAHTAAVQDEHHRRGVCEGESAKPLSRCGATSLSTQLVPEAGLWAGAGGERSHQAVWRFMVREGAKRSRCVKPCHPHNLLRSWNRCQMKAVTIASALVASVVVVGHWQAMLALYQAPSEFWTQVTV